MNLNGFESVLTNQNFKRKPGRRKSSLDMTQSKAVANQNLHQILNTQQLNDSQEKDISRSRSRSK